MDIMGKIRHLGDFMYLYFKDDGKLFMKSNVLEPDMESTYTKKCIVPKTFSLLKDGIDDDGNNMFKPTRKKCNKSPFLFK